MNECGSQRTRKVSRGERCVRRRAPVHTEGFTKRQMGAKRLGFAHRRNQEEGAGAHGRAASDEDEERNGN